MDITPDYRKSSNDGSLVMYASGELLTVTAEFEVDWLPPLAASHDEMGTHEKRGGVW